MFAFIRNNYSITQSTSRLMRVGKCQCLRTQYHRCKASPRISWQRIMKFGNFTISKFPSFILISGNLYLTSRNGNSKENTSNLYNLWTILCYVVIFMFESQQLIDKYLITLNISRFSNHRERIIWGFTYVLFYPCNIKNFYNPKVAICDSIYEDFVSLKNVLFHDK